ncbi:MAG: hypothetical protein J6D54_08880 [Olsenella sp.]|nr:hypothetical protein [Olsenella sp.]
MLQHDYLLEIIGKFVECVTVALLGVFKDGDFSRIPDAEQAVADLLDLDAETAMALAPQSLVTMMSLSGVGESVAGYAAYALSKVGDAYELAGDESRAELRRSQAKAISAAFGADDNEIPEEFEALADGLGE